MAKKQIFIDKPKFQCHRCGKEYETQMTFYKINSTLYSMDGRLPICKDCVKSAYYKNLNYFGSQKAAVKRTCMAFDFYYSDTIFEKIKEDDEEKFVFPKYVSQLNISRDKGKTFDDSIKEGVVFSTEEAKSLLQKIKKKNREAESEYVDDDTPDQKIIDFWGEGLDNRDYYVLERHYKELKSNNPNCDSNQEIFIMDLCKINLLKQKSLTDGQIDNFNKLADNYRKTFQQAGLKSTKDNASMDDFKLGVTAEMIEMYTPSEYYKNDKLYKDFDSIGDYFRRLVLRPLRNLQYGTDDRDEEYYVKTDDN